MQQGTDEWLAARVGVLTSTTFGDCLKKTAARETLILTKIAERLTGEWREVSARSLAWGKDHEQEARARYEITNGVAVSETGLIFHSDTPWIAVSPDGLVGDEGGVEIKCPETSKEHIRHIEKGLPPIYKPQVQGCLWITGRKWWDFVSYDPRMPIDLQLYVQRIFPDEEYIAEMEVAVLATDKAINERLRKLAA